MQFNSVRRLCCLSECREGIRLMGYTELGSLGAALVSSSYREPASVARMLVDRINPEHLLRFFHRRDIQIDHHGFIVAAD
jgi:hypothetical protein